MRKVYEYSHLGGAEILHVRYPAIDAEINDVIASVTGLEKIKVSREKTMPGRLLYSPKDINRRLKAGLHAKGFRELRLPFQVTLPNYPVIIKGAFKQVDFAKNQVLVESQFGKYSYMFYDMAKFQYFFNEEKAEVGVEIVACHGLYKEMSSGVAYGEQLIGDIIRLRRHFPAVPIKVILLDVDDAPPPKREEVEVSEEETLISSESAETPD